MVGTVGMEHFGLEDHFRRLIWEVIREPQNCLVESSFEWCILWTLETNSPDKHITFIEANRNREVALTLLSY